MLSLSWLFIYSVAWIHEANSKLGKDTGILEVQFLVTPSSAGETNGISE